MSDFAKNYAADFKEEAKNQAIKASEIGKDAILSHAYLYPIQGIIYALNHESVRGPITAQVMPRLILSAIVLIALFATVYVPQSLAMALFSGPLGFVSAVPLVLSEANVIVSILSSFLLTDKKDLLFDTVLLDQGMDEIVSNGRELSPSGGGKFKALKSKLSSPLQKFSPEALIKYLISIPLNMVPAIGTILFVTLNGRRAGPRFLARYFQLKGLSAQSRQEQVEKRTGSLTAFGVVTVLLGLVPVVSQVFEFTNVIGAALMAADIEKRNKSM